MKTRPITSILLSSTNSRFSTATLRNHHNIYNLSSPAVAFALHCRKWHSNTPRYCLNTGLIAQSSYRHASSSTATATKPLPPARIPSQSYARTPQLEPNPKLNPPSTSYAPPLDLPARAHNQSFPSYLWKCGRAYISFYKAGISNVRSTSKLAKTLRAKSANNPDILTRAEWQLVGRSRMDMLRLPAFGLLVLVFGEWVPVFALYITPLIPEPCRIPKQVERTLKKTEERRRDRKPGVSLLQDQRVPRALKVEAVDNMDTFALYNHAARLDAYSRIWDWMPFMAPMGVVKWGLKKKLGYLRRDDELIVRDGGWQGLGREEVVRACFERGIAVLDRSEAVMRQGLAEWFGGEGRGMARRKVGR
ncbi:hypothetical protein B0J11DRAFT_475605 [Dendryphion nanum]|uniref:Letm1 RBD domain-containing protein n=1 Tax=Dendryphion nanum TaxID=256645 RepID=A0A9P9IY97_9PLEO|nr:hypothetical protein B0J11DRAFT_475605 [Dendryphion nanum]